MQRQTIYLAGPITGLSYDGCTEWRDSVKGDLEAKGYKCLTPMRGKEHLQEIHCLPSGGMVGIASDHNIYERDRYDVHRCDILLVNLVGAQRVSVGTMFEMAWGWKAGKFVLTCMDSGNVHEHAFVKQASSLLVPSLTDAVNYLTNILNA